MHSLAGRQDDQPDSLDWIAVGGEGGKWQQGQFKPGGAQRGGVAGGLRHAEHVGVAQEVVGCRGGVPQDRRYRVRHDLAGRLVWAPRCEVTARPVEVMLPALSAASACAAGWAVGAGNGSPNTACQISMAA